MMDAQQHHPHNNHNNKQDLSPSASEELSSLIRTPPWAERGGRELRRHRRKGGDYTYKGMREEGGGGRPGCRKGRRREGGREGGRKGERGRQREREREGG